jgi:hypothetical protein
MSERASKKLGGLYIATTQTRWPPGARSTTQPPGRASTLAPNPMNLAVSAPTSSVSVSR